MAPLSQFKSWKRAAESQEDEQPNEFRSSQESQHVPEIKRFRTDANDAFHYGSVGQSSVHPPESRGHSYGTSAVSENGRLQNGDAYYAAGPSSQIWGPSVLNGNMRVHLSNVFHNYNYGHLDPNTNDAQEQALKSLLYYSTMDNRKAQLKEVTPKSFDWIWSQTTFPEWLSSDEGLFWISGKPASGKSTLIHHLSSRIHSNEVKRRLERSGEEWLLVRFYFDFRAGTSIANTTLGMLRSILSQIIQDSADIKKFVLNRCRHRLQGNWPELEAELFELICDAVKSTAISICSFVDGLDEYEDSLCKLINFLLTVQKRSGIKMCLASRPETEISHLLRGVPTFAMQDYNRGTIEAYIESATTDIGHLVPLEQLRHIFEEEVIPHASGVILWAVFAVDEGVKAALHGYTSKQIRQRVTSFPQELSLVYRRIWDKLAADDLQLAATILFVVQNWYSSFSGCRSGPIPPESDCFTVCCRMILRRLNPDFEADADYSKLHFRLKTYAILGGLVEFIPGADEATLAHKSVDSFLRKLPGYAQQTGKILQVVDSKTLVPTTFGHAVLEVCDALIPELDFFKLLLSGAEYIDNEPCLIVELLSTVRLKDYLRKLERKRSLDCLEETIGMAIYCITHFLDLFDLRYERHAALAISVTQTWLMQYYGIPYSLDQELSWPYHPQRQRSGSELNMSGHTWLMDIRPVYSHPEVIFMAQLGFDDAIEFQ